MIFFLGYFFLRTLDCLVSNCNWRNSQFISIKFTLLPLPPSCWNIRKKVCIPVWISIFVKWSVKLSDLPVFRRGNHWETIISKSIAVSYPGNFMIHDLDQGFHHYSASHNRVPRFTGKTRITRNTAEITERRKNNRELKYAIH